MKIPTTDLARRVAALFRRRLTTPWSDKEIRQYKKLVKAGCFDPLDDLVLIEQFYAFERRKGDDGIHRRDLCTFLNNFPGELDRATQWRERHPLKPIPRKIIPLPLVSSDEPVVMAEPEVHQRFLEELAQRKATRGKVASA
jgi:hypothetical protein